MTTVFVYEDVTATGAGGDAKSPPAPSLLAEGRAMLAAVTADFGVRTWRRNSDSAVECAAEAEFRRHVRSADYTLVIAPETGGRLEHLCRLVLDAGGKLLGPSPNAIRLTADKLELSRHWQKHCVPTPSTWPLGEEPPAIALIIKPRDGVGSQSMQLRAPDGGGARSASEDGGHDLACSTVSGTLFVAQEYIPGFAASVAFLNGPHLLMPLVPCEQILSDDGRFRYLGGRLPIAQALAERALRIAEAAVNCVPGLLGYVGVDVVLGDDGRDWAIEINPRLTTSYVGLRALARFNLAEAMLATVCGEPLPEMTWSDGPIAFTPDGRISLLGD